MSKYPVEISANEDGSFTLKNGTETVASGTTLDEGTVLTITATPAYMKQLDALLINGVDVVADYNENDGYSFELATATSIEVVFGDLTATLTYEVTGAGYIECWSACDEETFDPAGTQYENGASLPVNGDLYVYPYSTDVAIELLSLTINGEDYMGEIEEYGSAYYIIAGNVNIVAEFSTPGIGIEEAAADAVSVYAADATIYVNGFEGTAQVVNISGQVVKEFAVNGKAQVAMEQGIYFVVTGNQVSKVVVK